ncbi:MAG: substrate-binding domain-containing protein [Treponema sp.]|jgi:methyl-galactoside transport system substrate-binding protein|nr:substrate-binding domain-containing protein [Treponema sp.]
MKNKWLGSLLICGLAFVFAACDSIVSGNEYVPKIGVILSSYPYLFDAVDIKEGFDNQNNWKAISEFVYSERDQEKQYGQIDTFLLEEKVDVLAVCLANNGGDNAVINAVMAKAKAAGIPLVFFSSETNGQPDFYEIRIDQNEVAGILGKILADYWKDPANNPDRNGDGDMQYLMVHGPLANMEAKARKEKTIPAIEAEGITVDCLKEFDGEWGMNPSKKAELKAWLEGSVGSTVEAVICGNDQMALDVIDVLAEIPALAGIPIVGTDGTDEAIAAINEGKMLGTVLQDFVKVGAAVFDVCYALGVGNAVTGEGHEWTLTGKIITIPPKGIQKEE